MTNPYTVIYQNYEALQAWFVEDSDGCLAFGDTFLQAWSNLHLNREANGFEIAVEP